jgi:hypothetical protein
MLQRANQVSVKSGTLKRELQQHKSAGAARRAAAPPESPPTCIAEDQAFFIPA